MKIKHSKACLEAHRGVGSDEGFTCTDNCETFVSLKCDMTEDCTNSISHIDEDGFIYCTLHGKARQQFQRCRKLKPAELRRLESGNPLASYRGSNE